jgi:hypothetical protein
MVDVHALERVQRCRDYRVTKERFTSHQAVHTDVLAALNTHYSQQFAQSEQDAEV